MLPLPLVEAAQADAGGSLLERLINGADAIVIGTAVEQSSYWNDERTRIYTSVILSVEETLKGTTSEDRVAVILPGGKVDEIGEWVSHIPRFGDGERALVFLKELSWAEVPDVGDSAQQLPEKQFQILCNSEAKLSIVEDRVGELPLNTFKEQVNRAINGQALSDEELDVPVSVITSPYSYSGYSWPHPPPPVVKYRINENTSDCIGEGAAVQAAAAIWNAAGALFSFSYAGTTTAVAPTNNGVNEIVWRNLGNIVGMALTTTWVNTITNDIVECDVEFNDYYTFSTAAVPPSDRYDVQTIGLHEFGHWLMLDDLSNPGDSAKVMYKYGSPGEVKRTLHADDIAGIRYIYGVAQAPPNAPSNPSPANHAAGVSISADLSWIGGDPDAGDTVTYDVYFGTISTPPLVSGSQGGTSYDPGTLADNTKYYWRIIATDNHGASTTGPLWDFTTGSVPNNPPNVPSNPSPANHAAGVDTNADLAWIGGDPDGGDTVSYDVYFGTGSTPPLVSDNQAGIGYDPGTLADNTKYYWQIVATDNHGASTTGPLWDFTTQVVGNNPPSMPSSPSPANHATGVSVTADLGWIGGDPDAGDTVTYDVYFGASATPPLVSNDQSATTHDPGTLANDTKYYWQIVATDNHGASTTGPLWDFSTITIGGPDITVSPASFEVTLPPDTIQDYTLTIGNSGGATLTYSIIDKETTGGIGVAGSEDVFSVEPATMVLEVPLESRPVQPQNTGLAATGWQIIMSDGFEGMFPGVWDVHSIAGYTDAYWGKDSYNAHSGSYSAFCAKSGSAGVSPPADYPANMDAWMIYGPFSLEDAIDAELNFYYWLDTEYDYDYLWWGASVDGEEFYGYLDTGYNGGWVSGSFDLSRVPTLWNLAGETQVWIAFLFESDEVVSYSGAFIDDVVLRKYVGAANNPPNMPSNPSPANHAAGVSINADLRWTGGDPDAGDTVTYDVYFGTSSNPPVVSNDQLGTTYDPGTLADSAKYYWKIIATDNHGASTTGPVWDFTTGSASNNPPNTPSSPSPANHATGVSINADLRWTGGDPDAGDTVAYDVYFGTSTTPPLVSDDQSGTTCDLGTLAYNTKYYWKIVATDNNGAFTSGGVWDFTTGGVAGDCPWLDENPKSSSVPAGGSNDITVTINTAGLTVGNTYTAEIVIANNDPDENPKVVPVTLRVRVPGATVAWSCPLGSQTLIAPNPGKGRPYLSAPADCAGITMSAGAALWGIYYLVETGPSAGTWKWYIPGFASSTLTQLEPNGYYWVVVSAPCTLRIPQ
jgi:hypothetical protein